MNNYFLTKKNNSQNRHTDRQNKQRRLNFKRVKYKSSFLRDKQTKMLKIIRLKSNQYPFLRDEQTNRNVKCGRTKKQTF
jgi:hypothetical protein